jgi:tRNA A-37 threonylcarbamoyl transferase component Bud32
MQRIGDYRIERELTPSAYEGVHLVLPRRAAVEVSRPDNKLQLLRQACILEALSHPGVPRIYECGVLPDKRPWVATELIDGTPLSDDTPVAITDLAVVVRSVGDILAHAHARGVVHHRLTEAVVLLTPQRLSPVTVRGWGDVVARDSTLAAEPSCDIHALGAIAYRTLTGSVLTPGASAQMMCPEAPGELTKLIDDMLAGEPPSAVEVCERIDWLGETLAHPTRARGRAKHPRAGTNGFAVRIRG